MPPSRPPGDGARAPRLVALLPTVWSVRNVVYGGVLRRLAAAGVDVRVLVPRRPSPAALAARPAFADATEIHELRVASPRLAPRPGAGNGVRRGKELLEAAVRAGFSHRHGIASYEIYARWLERRAPLRERLHTRVAEALGVALRRDALRARAVRAVERGYRDLYVLEPARAHLRELAPDLVYSTACILASEYPYSLAAKDLGVRTVASIPSFDNLTSRGVLPRFDDYLVWNERMRDQLLRFYPAVEAAKVRVTGTPQFDFHVRPEYRWERPRTLAALGLPSDARYLLYSASHQQLTPDEPALVAELARRARAHPALGGHMLVVRLHPLEDWSRWNAVRGAAPHVVLSPAWDEPPDASGWTLASPDGQARLVSSIAHADACVNIASTMSLDAAILDRPVVGIDFRGEPDAPRDVLYGEYEAEHYRPLVQSGGIRVARSWSELLDLLETAVGDPARDRAARAGMARSECGTVDGHAADRVADALLELLGVREATAPAARSAVSEPHLAATSGR